ncbi:MAG TPA: universal stress protein [Thermomicrobiales bacterium]|nr:universal stress protein [Thermomicrobiales bacterium]
MLNTILVPLDGSPLAELALRPAEALARTTGARLILLHATPDSPGAGLDTGRLQVAAPGAAERYLGRLAGQLAERGIVVTTEAPRGDAAAAICVAASRSGADLIVMTTHGRGGLGRWVYGAVAEALLRRAPAPILLVRAWRAESPAPLPDGRQRLLVPLDGSEAAEAALPVAARLAHTLGADLVLLRVVPRRRLDAAGGLAVDVERADLEDFRAEALHYLRRVAGRPVLDGLILRLDIRVGEPAAALVAAGREYRASLVVLATHGQSGPQRVLLGGVATTVLRDGETPLVLVPPSVDAAGSAGEASLDDEEEDVAGGSPVRLAVHEDDVVLLRAALRAFDQAVPGRRDHLHRRIGRLLDRLDSDALQPVG